MSTLEVVWLPSELARRHSDPAVTVVIDVIRATTSIATALAAGASRVVPAPSVAQARQMAGRIDGGLLCGERRGLPPEGFDLGNSPRAFTPETVSGKDLVFTTTNGTAAIEAVRASERLYLAAFRNAGATVRRVGRDLGRGGGVRIVCAGRQGGVGMDDAWCAGHLVERICAHFERIRLDDGARAALALARQLGAPSAIGLADTAAGRALGEIGLAEDLTACAAVDDLDVLPSWRRGAFVKGGEEDA